MTGTIDSDKLQSVVASNIETLCRHFFPDGKKERLEWKLGDSSGSPGRSLGIALNPEKAGLWRDRATGESGNFVRLLMKARNCGFLDACSEIGRFLGIDLTSNRNSSGSFARFNWEAYERLGETERERLSKWRGYSPEFVSFLSESDLIRVDNNGVMHWVLPIHKDGRIAGAHSRPAEWKEGRAPWKIYPTKEQGGPGVQPLIIGDPKPDVLHIFESQWDQFAVCDRLHLHETDRFASISTRGSSNSRFAEIISPSVCEVYVWKQNDAAGEQWAAKIGEQLPSKISAKIVRIPREFKDPNDWTRAGATAEDLLGAIKNAVPIGTDNARKGRELLGGSIVTFANAKIDETKTLLGRRYLCVGGGMFIVAQSGIGKSSAAIQATILWSCGRPAFDIKPARPLRILVVQAEDDVGDVTEAARMIFKLDLTEEELDLVAANTWIEHINDVCGEAFITELGGILERWLADLVIINPYTAYLGSDDKDTEACTRFLRNRVNPLLTKHQCAVIFIHHTPKTNFNSTENYKPSDWMYRGAGAATLTNWARAYIVIDPCEGASGVFKFIAAKRAKRIGWSDREPIFEKFFRHSKEPGVILWEPADRDEVATAQSGFRGKSVDKEKLLALVPMIDPVLKDSLTENATKNLGVGINKIKATMRELELEGKVFSRSIPNPNGGRAYAGWAKTTDVSGEKGEVE
jgi:hypothetical protein